MRTSVLWALCLILVSGMWVHARGDETREARIRRLTHEALILRKEGRIEEAKQRLAQAERELPVTPGQPPQAAKTPVESEKTAAGEAVDPGKLFAEGLAAMAAKDLDTATEKFQAVVRLDPNSFEAHNNLAVIYAEQDKEERALSELRAALRLRPDYYRGRKNLAELYTRLASRAYKEAAAVAPLEEREPLLERGRELAALSQTETRVAKAPAATPPRSSNVVVTPAVAAAAATPTVLSVASAPETTTGPAPAANENTRPRQFLALGGEGTYGIVIDRDHLWLYREKNGTIRLDRSIPVKAGKGIPPANALYVAAVEGARVVLVPLKSGARRLTLRSSGQGATSITLDSEDLKTIAGLVDSYLTPVLVTSHVDLVSNEEAEDAAPEIAAAFHTWGESWDKKDLDRYVASYAPAYVPEGERGHDAWRRQRERIFSLSGDVSVEHSAPAILRLDGDVMTLAKQRYRSALQVSTGVKSLTWTSTPQGWRITREQMLSERIEPGER